MKSKGFTLMELLAVVVIVGILLAVALPSYQSYVRRGGAQGAAADLVALSLVLENRYQLQLQYPLPGTNPTTTTAQTQSYTASGSNSQAWAPARADRFDYTLQVSSAGYTLTASGKADAANAGCTLTLDHGNNRSASGGAACGGLSTW